MAYQSKFSGAEIDEVITYCKTGNNLQSLSKLEEYIQTITTNSTDLTDLKTTILQQQNLLENKVMLLTGGELTEMISPGGFASGGQIIKAADSQFYDARNKAMLRLKESPNTYAPLYSCNAGNEGDINYGIVPMGDNVNYKMIWNYTPNSDFTNKVNTGTKELASITTLGQVFGAVWNDFAEFRQSDEMEPGRVVCENGDGTLSRSQTRLQPGAAIVSDTYGFAIGETNECQTPIAVAGRVLAYPYEDWWTFEPGEAVCAGPNGTVSKMTRREIRKYPERIIGTVSELPIYETWGQNNVKINGRIWIRIK